MADAFNRTLPERVDGVQTDYGKFAQHRRDARARAIEFSLTFKQWLRIWRRSGKYELRGTKLGQYVMARIGDVGPYAIGNVKIITAAENHREANIGSKRPKTAAWAHQHSNQMRGRTLTEVHKMEISRGVLAAFTTSSSKERRRARRV